MTPAELTALLAPVRAELDRIAGAAEAAIDRGITDCEAWENCPWDSPAQGDAIAFAAAVAAIRAALDRLNPVDPGPVHTPFIPAQCFSLCPPLCPPPVSPPALWPAPCIAFGVTCTSPALWSVFRDSA